MARTLQIGKKALDSGSIARVNNVPALKTEAGWNERLRLVASSVTPERMHTIIRNASEGDLTHLYEVYDKMDAELHFGGLIDQVLRTLSGATVKLEPALDPMDKALAKDYYDFCKEVLLNTQTRALIKMFAATGLRGVGVFQTEYDVVKYGSKYLAIPKKVQPIHGQRYLWEKTQGNPKWGELKIKTSVKPDGVYVSDLPRSNIFMLADGEGKGRWDLLGVYRRAMSWWLLKVYAAGWWGDKVEMFGEPFRIGRYPQGTKQSIKDEIASFLENMGRTAYALIPENINMQLLESVSGQGGLSSHHELIRYIDDRMAFTVLGQTDSSTSARYGSKARSESVFNVTWDILRDYAAIVSEGFNAYLCAAIDRNYGSINKRSLPKASLIIINPEIADGNATKFVSMATAGIPISVAEVYEQTGTTRPAQGDLVYVNGTLATYDESAYKRQSTENAQLEQDQSSGSGSEDDRKDDSGSDD